MVRPAKEQEAAKALIAQKCDVIFSNAQDTPSVISACEEAGVYSFNLNSSMKKYAPKTYLGCISTDWSPFFKASVDAHLAGTFKGANTFLGVAEKVVEVIDWNPDVPGRRNDQDQGDRGKDRRRQLLALHRADHQGRWQRRRRIRATMADPEIIAMDWHVKGVATPLPK
jgi:basic membrane protein A